MVEIKLVTFAAYIHKLALRLALSSLNHQSKKAIKTLDTNLDRADNYRTQSRKLLSDAELLESDAHKQYNVRANQVETTYYHMRNALDRV